ncbi:MAG TPA: VOC family protein [Gemmatimonadaceae bacterium]
MPSAAHVTGIAQIYIMCRGVPRAVVFYRDVVGLPLLFETNGMAFFQAGPTRLMLSKPEVPAIDHPSSLIYFGTADIAGAVGAVKGAGGKVETDPHIIAKMNGKEIWLCEWHDTEGNIMAFMEERPVAA